MSRCPGDLSAGTLFDQYPRQVSQVEVRWGDPFTQYPFKVRKGTFIGPSIGSRPGHSALIDLAGGDCQFIQSSQQVRNRSQVNSGQGGIHLFVFDIFGRRKLGYYVSVNVVVDD